MPLPITIEELNSLLPLPVQGPLTNQQLRASSFSVKFDGAQPVVGPLTHAELRSTPLAVTTDPNKPFMVTFEPGYGAATEEKQPAPMPPGSPSNEALTVQGHPLMTPLLVTLTSSSSSGLTDAQLRTSAVPVSLATLPALAAGAAVIGHVIVDTAPTTAVTAASLPLPSGAATSAKQDTGNTSLSSIDGKITTVNTGAVVVSSSALPSGAATSAKQDTGNTSLSSIDGKITAVNTGAVTISAALPAGSNVIGHVIADTGSTTAVTGNVTVVQPTGTNLHVVVDSAPAVTGTVTANAGTNLNTSLLALEAGGNLALSAAYLLAIGNQNANIVTATQTTATAGSTSTKQDTINTTLGTLYSNDTQNVLPVLQAMLAEMRIQTLMLQMAFNIPDDMNSLRGDPNITLQ